MTTADLLDIFTFVSRSILTVPRRVPLIKDEGVYISGSKKEPKEKIVDKGKVKWFNERKDSGLYMTARKWSLRLPRVKRAPKQRMCVPANLDCGVFGRENHGPTEWWGLFN